MSLEKLEQRHEQAHDIWANNFDCDTISFLQNDNVAEVDKVILLVGKMNCQVENGGFQQYFDNGYAIGVVGAFQNHKDNYDQHGLFAHDWLKAALETIVDEHMPATARVIELMTDFSDVIEFDEEQYEYVTCDECCGIGEVDAGDLDEDGEDQVEVCTNCDGDGDEEVSNENYLCITDHAISRWNELATKYYVINDQFLREIQSHYILDLDENVRQRVKAMDDIGRRLAKMPEPYKSFVEQHLCEVDLCLTCVKEDVIKFLLENSNTAEDMIEGARHVYLADVVPEGELRMIFHAYLLGMMRVARHIGADT